MKASEVRKLDVDEIDGQIVDFKRTLLKLRFQHEVGQLENPRKISGIRKNIARLETILTEKTKLTK